MNIPSLKDRGAAEAVPSFRSNDTAGPQLDTEGIPPLGLACEVHLHHLSYYGIKVCSLIILFTPLVVELTVLAVLIKTDSFFLNVIKLR